ncbi:MAG TPA: MMPL family transporter [Methylomirabilota bacterium]|nr:MMPL family transporter [Methylomirabilota bacterium]
MNVLHPPLKRLARTACWLLLIPLAAGLVRLRLDTEVLDLLPPGLPEVRGLRLYHEYFANQRDCLITVQAPNAEMAEEASRALVSRLRARPDLVTRITWQPPWLEQPLAGVEFIAALWFNQAPEIFGALTNRLLGAGAEQTLAATKERLAVTFSPADLAALARDPFGLLELPGASLPGSDTPAGRLFHSADGSFRVLFVEAQPPLPTYRQCAEWLGQVDQIVAAARTEGAISADTVIRYTGRPVFLAETATSMERDMISSVFGTLVIVSGLFYWAHRSWRPLLRLLALLLATLAITLAIGGLWFGTLNVISLGFAAILIGLVVDYGLIQHQEMMARPGHPVGAIRRAVAGGIGWSAVTTAGAFLTLNLTSLPGLGELGWLVAVGVATGAALMLGFALKSAPPAPATARALLQAVPGVAPDDASASRVRPVTAAVTTVALLAGAALLVGQPPRFDRSASALRLRGSTAFEAAQELQEKLGLGAHPLWMVIPGRDEGDARRRMVEVDERLRRAQAGGTIESYALPLAIWPQPDHQAANRSTARLLAGQLQPLRRSVLAAGFTAESLDLTATMLQVWAKAAESDQTFWPTDDASRWVFDQSVARTDAGWIVLATVHLRHAPPGPEGLADALRDLPGNGVLLASWELLGAGLFAVVARELPGILSVMALLITAALAFAFRAWRPIALGWSSLAAAAVLLGAIMAGFGWSWNLMNLMALPLLLGAGVDYSIHVQLALRRHHGNITAVRHTVGRALFLCAATTAAGFGSMSFSSNAGLASLGQVCAAGILSSYVVAVHLLPFWWRWAHGTRRPEP